MVEIFRGRIIDVSPKTYTIMITGDEAKIKAFLALIRPLGIKELVRTGPIAMLRGEKTIKMREKHSKGGEEDGQDYYDKDADLDVLKGVKVAIIGYGSQGHAQART